MVVEVIVGNASLVDDTCWVVVPSTWAVVTRALVETVVCLGDHDGDAVVVVLVKVSTLSDTGCVVSVTVSTTTGLNVVEAGGGLEETVVTVVSATLNTGGGVTSFLVVVAGISAVETAAGALVVVTVVTTDVTEVVTGVDVMARRGASVVEVTWTLDENSGVTVVVWTGVEVVCT